MHLHARTMITRTLIKPSSFLTNLSSLTSKWKLSHFRLPKTRMPLVTWWLQEGEKWKRSNGLRPKLTVTLQKTKLKLLTDEECDSRYEKIFDIEAFQLCAELVNQTEEPLMDTCLNDMGGPVYSVDGQYIYGRGNGHIGNVSIIIIYIGFEKNSRKKITRSSYESCV